MNTNRAQTRADRTYKYLIDVIQKDIDEYERKYQAAAYAKSQQHMHFYSEAVQMLKTHLKNIKEQWSNAS